MVIPLIRLRSLTQLSLQHPLPRHALDLIQQLALRMQVHHVVAAANALPVHEHVRYRAAAGFLLQHGLQLGSEGMLVELDDKRRRHEGVVREYRFGFLREGTVGFREDDY